MNIIIMKFRCFDVDIGIRQFERGTFCTFVRHAVFQMSRSK